MLAFHDLTIEDQALVCRYTRGSRLSFHQFSNMYMWREVMRYRVAEEDGILYVTSNYHGRYPGAFFPFCEEGREEEALFRLRQALPGPLRIRPVTHAVADWICALCPEGEKLFQRGGSDYVYRTSDLIDLSGRKYHAKKNHVNAFCASYHWEYHDVTPKSTPQTLALLREAAELLYQPGLGIEREEEHLANLDMIDHLAQLSLRAAILTVEDRPVAYSVGEQILSDTALIHIEKADKDFKGAYAAINQMFASYAWSHLTWINREEDMGIEGLRRAKESYHPAMMNEVYAVQLPALE